MYRHGFMSVCVAARPVLYLHLVDICKVAAGRCERNTENVQGHEDHSAYYLSIPKIDIFLSSVLNICIVRILGSIFFLKNKHIFIQLVKYVLK